MFITYFTLMLILLTPNVPQINSQEIKEKDNILILNKSNFDHAINNHSYLLVKFFSPYCVLSKKLEPEYIAAAKKLQETGIPIRLAEVESTTNQNLIQKFNIDGFPNLKLFILGTPTEYNGGRTSLEIVSWIKKNTGFSSLELNTPLEVNSFIEEHEVTMVAFSLDNSELELYQKVAKENIDAEFAHCGSQECLSYFETKPGEIFLSKKYDEKRHKFVEEVNEENLKVFLQLYTFPLVMNFDSKCAAYIFGKDQPGLFFYLKENDENNEKYEAIAKEVALNIRGQIQVVKTGLTNDVETKLGKYTNVKKEDLPTVRLHDTTGKLKSFSLKTDITVENVIVFFTNWKNGFIKSELKSQEKPETNDGAITIVVGKTFNELVIKPNKNVFIMIYDPNSISFSKLAPLWMDLAKQYLNHDSITIAMMDGKNNEIDTEIFESFPLIKLWKKGKKDKPINYIGDADLDLFNKFLEINCKEEDKTEL